jgi:hypothetical protein
MTRCARNVAVIRYIRASDTHCDGNCQFFSPPYCYLKRRGRPALLRVGTKSVRYLRTGQCKAAEKLAAVYNKLLHHPEVEGALTLWSSMDKAERAELSKSGGQ